MTYEPEDDVPETLTEAHLGSRVVFRIPNQAVLSEGEIAEFSSSGRYLRIGKRWLANQRGTVLAMLNNMARRRSPYDA
jgi:hypothetical protein